MDINQRRPDHPDYDKTTLHIPEEVWKTLSSSKIQYWRLKQQNFDKVFFFKVGKFYEVFYDDAVICHKELKLHLMFS
jgi:DNA mismatch repair protein MSH6